MKDQDQSIERRRGLWRSKICREKGERKREMGWCNGNGIWILKTVGTYFSFHFGYSGSWVAWYLLVIPFCLPWCFVCSVPKLKKGGKLCIMVTSRLTQIHCTPIVQKGLNLLMGIILLASVTISFNCLLLHPPIHLEEALIWDGRWSKFVTRELENIFMFATLLLHYPPFSLNFNETLHSN